jgi:hypothetical protein
MMHKQTQIYKTHLGLDLGDANTFPLIIFSMPGHEAYNQMSFCPESLEIPKIGVIANLEAHNFLCKPSIKLRFQKKL